MYSPASEAYCRVFYRIVKQCRHDGCEMHASLELRTWPSCATSPSWESLDSTTLSAALRVSALARARSYSQSALPQDVVLAIKPLTHVGIERQHRVRELPVPARNFPSGSERRMERSSSSEGGSRPRYADQHEKAGQTSST